MDHKTAHFVGYMLFDIHLGLHVVCRLMQLISNPVLVTVHFYNKTVIIKINAGHVFINLCA